MRDAAGSENYGGRSYDWPRACLVFAAYAAMLCLVQRDTLTDMAAQWLRSSSFHHAPLAAPLSLFLCWRKRASLSAPRFWPPALAAIAGVSVIGVTAQILDANIIAHLSFVSLLITGAVLLIGPRNARALALPLALLLFLAPFGASLMPVLQSLAAGCTHIILSLIGVDAARNGLTILTSAGAFHIAPGCAGLNFLLVAAMASFAFAADALPRPMGIVFFAASIIAALFANSLRIALVIVLSGAEGAGNLAEDHLAVGAGVYALMLFALMAFGRRLRAAAIERF